MFCFDHGTCGNHGEFATSLEIPEADGRVISVRSGAALGRRSVLQLLQETDNLPEADALSIHGGFHVSGVPLEVDGFLSPKMKNGFLVGVALFSATLKATL